jgi:hypothetical protein
MPAGFFPLEKEIIFVDRSKKDVHEIKCCIVSFLAGIGNSSN